MFRNLFLRRCKKLTFSFHSYIHSVLKQSVSPVQVAVASNVACLPHSNMNKPAGKLTAGDTSFPESEQGDPTDGMAGPQPVLFAPDPYGHYQETSPVEENPPRSAAISEAGTGGLNDKLPEGTNTNAEEVEEPSFIQSLLLLMALQGIFGEQADSTAPRILPFPIKRMEDLVSAVSTGVENLIFRSQL
jgi:hypothetical protein